MKILILLVFPLLAFISCTQQSEPKDDPLAIPYCEEIEIDSSSIDWELKGLNIPLFLNLYGEQALEDFSANMKLAWDHDNLYFLVEAEDDQVVEQASVLRGDGLEIFISEKRGSSKMVQYIVSPGLSDKYRVPRIDKYDYEAIEPIGNVDDLTVIAFRTPGGYRMEGKIPFEKTGISPYQGARFAINLYLSDVDPDERKTRYALFFNQDTWLNHYALRDMILSGQDGETDVKVIVKAYTEDRKIHRIRVIGNASLAGGIVSISDGYGYEAKSVFSKKIGSCEASFDIPVGEIDSAATFIQLVCRDSSYRALYFRDLSQRYVTTERPNRWEDDILFFEEKDKLQFPAAGGVLFTGSSSIRNWDARIDEDFEGYNVICRGFGGSRTQDALYYFDRIVAPYQPSVIVLAEGSNDLRMGQSPGEVVNLTEQFILKAAGELPDAKVLVLSIKVSVSNKRLVGTVMKTNRMLQEMISRHGNAIYVDVISEMLTADGKVRHEIFTEDSTHMNAAGYEIWTRVLHPYLEQYATRD